MAFSPDGKQVVSGSFDDETVRLWDAATGAPLQTLEGHTSAVTSVAFSPDGRPVDAGLEPLPQLPSGFGTLRHRSRQRRTGWTRMLSPARSLFLDPVRY